MKLTHGERLAATAMIVELGVLTACTIAIARLYRAVKGKNG